MQRLTMFDWVLIALLAWSTFAAFRRGLIRVLFSLAGTILGILFASWYYAALAPRLLTWFHPLATAQAVAFVAILIGIVLLASLLGMVVRRGASAIGLGFLDRLGGAAFGLARGFLLGVALMMAITAFYADSSVLTKSRLTPYFLAGAHAVCFFVPENLQVQIASGTTRLKHISPDWIKSK